MVRAVGTAVKNNFVNGLITETTGLNFPENAVKDCDNVVFERTGIVRRRYGFNYEDSFTTETLDNSGVSQLYEWETVGRDASVKFVVAQRGSSIRFYLVDAGSLTAKSFTVDLTSYKTSTSSDTEVEQNKASFSYGDGKLFIAHKHCDPIYVKYDSDADDITVTQIEVRVRDLTGVDDGLLEGQRPTTLSLEHEYNLQNQGWYPHVEANAEGVTDPGGGNFGVAGGIKQNPLKAWANARTDYPSNSDVWFVYKDTNQLFNVNWVWRFDIGNTPAAKGHYVYNAFNIQRAILYGSTSHAPDGSQIVDTVTVVDTESAEGNRPEFTAFFAGRVWWSGVSYEDFSSRIYFSKIIESDRDYGKCFQQNDPTSEYASDLLPSDGGVVVIPDIAKVVYMVNLEDALVVMATNGVWVISGAEFDGFTADSYRVTRLSTIGCLSAYSVVVVEGIPIWWSTSGMYTLAKNEATKAYDVVNITNQNIKSFYELIPASNKVYAQGSYNKLERTVTWVYRSTAASTFEDNFAYDRVLRLNIDTRAFFPYTLGSLCHIAGLVEIQGNSTKTIQENVVDNASAQVVDGVAANVTADVPSTGITGSVIKYWAVDTSVGTADTDGYTFAEENDTRYVDWFSVDSTGDGYDSYFEAGYMVRGESHKNQQNTYVTFTSESTSGSSFFVEGRWDYATSSNSNKFSTRQQGYVHDGNRSYAQRKLKIRGKGPVLQYYVRSDGTNPFAIAGWAAVDTVAGVV